MTDTGIPKPVAGAGPQLPQSRQEQSARVENATGQLAHVLRPVRVEGAVTRHNDNGTVRISTPQGDIDLRLRGTHLSARGQRVEIDLPAGHPPRQATVRAAAEQPASPSSARAAQNTAAAPATDEAVPPPPLLLEYGGAETLQLAAPSAANRPPETVIQPGDLARLTPLTAQEAAALEAAVTVSTASVQPLPAASLVFRTKTAAEIAAENVRLIITLPTQSDAATTRPRTPGESAHTLFHSAPRLSSQPVTLEATAAPLAKSITPLGVLDIRITAITSPAVKITSPGAAAAQKIAGAVNPFFSPSTPATALEKAKAAHAGLPVPTVSAPPPQAASAASLTATVTGRTADNFPVLTVLLPGQTLPAHFALRINAANLTDGTVISFIPQAAAPALSDNAAEAGPASGLSPAFQWAAFSNLKAVVTQIDPRIVQSFTQTLPNAASPSQIPAAALFFVAAVRSGDIVSWLGDKTIDAIRRAGRGDAIDRLSKEMNDAGKAEGASKAPGQWHSLPLPMVAGGDIQRMMLYYRHDRDSEGQDRDKTHQTRFIFDMDLTRMGVVQLDGLHRPAGKDSKLDLIVRTGAPLSQTMQQSMRRAYVSALEQTGHTGEMSFQHRPEQFVKVDGLRG